MNLANLLYLTLININYTLHYIIDDFKCSVDNTNVFIKLLNKISYITLLVSYKKIIDYIIYGFV